MHIYYILNTLEKYPRIHGKKNRLKNCLWRVKNQILRRRDYYEVNLGYHGYHLNNLLGK